MEETWRAPVIDRFSMSEIFGGATQDPFVEWWHFDPWVHAEVIGTSSGRPIMEGIGMLVLTAFCPFQEAQPLIRYLTGDLVEVTYGLSSSVGEIAIRPLGRAKYGVPLPGSDEWILTPAAILESIDVIPEIARMPLFRDSAQVCDPFSIGLPKYQLSTTLVHGTVKAVIGVAAKHNLTASGEEELKQRLSTELLRNHTSLEGYLESGAAKLSIVLETDIKPNDISR
jgi:hypothetical protein